MTLHEVVQHGKGHVGTNRTRAIAQQQSRVHHFANLTALHNKCRLYALANTYQVMMYGTYSQEAWNCSTLLIDVSIGKDNVVNAVIYTLLGYYS